MSDIKGVFKGGWHPKGKEGGKESWRGDFKGINQVAGWVGKGKKPGTDVEGSSHVSRPLTTLKDPALFGPPPKNVNYHGGAALPNEITPHTGGIGAPLSQSQLENSSVVSPTTLEEHGDARTAPPPLPFRSDRTGLRTDNLPPPPARRERDVAELEDTQLQRPKAVPSLPPRLPSRQNTASPVVTAPPPAYELTASPTRSPVTGLNQSAVNRLGSAGISVPGLGIGGKNTSSPTENPWSSAKSQNQSMSGLSSRFQRLNSRTSQQSDQELATATSLSAQTALVPTWSQTQSTLKTAQNFHKDPSSVSLADAQQAAATAQQAHTNAQDFRARHADKIDAAERKATAFNKKYNMTGRLNKFLEDANNEHDQVQQQQSAQPVQPGQQAAPPVLPIHPNAGAGAVTGNTPPTQTQTQAQPQSQPQTQPVSYQRASPALPSNTPTPAPNDTTAAVTSTTTTTNIEDLTKSIGRKPPPPPPPKKPSSLQSPPPVPLGTRPNF